MGSVIGAMLLPVLISLTGPIYYGVTGGPPWRVAIWGATCLIGFIWLSRAALRRNIGELDNANATKAFVAIILVSGAFFEAGDYLAYFLARSFSN